MDERADAGDDQRHHGRERVEAQREIGMELARRESTATACTSSARARGHRQQLHEAPSARPQRRAKMTPGPTRLTAPRPARRPKNRLNRTPSAGNSRIRPSAGNCAVMDQPLGSPAHQVEFVGVDGFAVAENRDDDRQARPRLRPPPPSSRRTRSPARPSSPAAAPSATNARLTAFSISSIDMNMTMMLRRNSTPGDADREQHGAQRHEVAHRNHHQAPSDWAARGCGCDAAAEPAAARRASATAPTTAASSSTEVISNAIR